MAKEETLKEAWEKLPAWKKTYSKIIAVIAAIGVITAIILNILLVKEFY